MLRILIPLIVLVSVIVSISFVKRKPWTARASCIKTAGSFIYGCISCLQLGGVIILMGSFFVQSDEQATAVNVQFPLDEGIYSIMHAGNNEMLNYHYRYPSQKYAVDIIALRRPLLNRINNNSEIELSDYEIFGDTVYAPVSGKIIKVVDDISDAPHGITGSVRSNLVAIEYGDVYILLLHLKEGSIVVSEGQLVTAGKAIAQVGNSGLSSEPHLHMHAVRKDENLDNLYKGISVPIKVNGRFLKRNDLFYNRNLIFR